MDMSRTVAIVGLVAALAGAGIAGLGVRAGVWTWPRGGQSSTAAPSAASAGSDTITVVGTGRTSVTPDTFTFTIGVQPQQPTARGAIDVANAEIIKVVQALKALGVAAADIQTTSLSVSKNQVPGQPITYEAHNDVTAIVRNLSQVSATLAAATDAAGNDVELGGMSFSNEHIDTVITADRQSAIDAAQAQARQWAKLANRHLGHIVSVSEPIVTGGTVSPAQPGGGMGGGGVPISAGQNIISVSVNVVYALD
jgi:uncharacterized protein YggE